MEYIKINKNGGSLNLKVGITGKNIWNFVYAVEDYSFRKKYPDNQPFEISLGMPGEIINDNHEFRLRIVNPGQEDQSYNAKLTWSQDGRVVHEWSNSGRTGKDDLQALLTLSIFILEG